MHGGHGAGAAAHGLNDAGDDLAAAAAQQPHPLAHNEGLREEQLGAGQHILRQLLRAEAEGDAGDATRRQQRLHVHAHHLQHLHGHTDAM